jgi:hypothetical protein
MGEIALSCIAPLYEGSVTAETGAMLVVTDPRPWAFSADANFELPAIKERLQTIPVTVGVESGALGVGWLAADGATWVEHVVARTGTTGELNLAIPAGTVGGKLVFDNQRADGEPSRAIIEGIRLILSDDDHDQAASAEDELGDDGTSAIHCGSTCSDEPAAN